MRARSMVALAELSLGTILGWGFAFLLTLVLALDGAYTVSNAFGTACMMAGLVAVGMGALADRREGGGYGISIAVIVAFQLLAVSQLA